MISKALMAASTKPIILSILQHGESYGYQIVQRVKQLSDGKLQWSDGTFYPVLHRMEKDGLLHSQWKMSENERMSKYYRITDLGLEALEKEKEQWSVINETFTKLWTAQPSFSF